MGEYDVIVIGAGFSGLSSALSLAKQGLKVGVIDRKEKIGKPIQTTGIFFQGTVDSFLFPNEFINNQVKGVFIYAPSEKCYPIKFETPKFYMVDIFLFQKWLAEECKKWGVKFQLKNQCIDISIKEKKVNVNEMNCKVIVLSCGSNTELVKKLVDDYVKKFLIGSEIVIKGVNARDDKYFEWFVNLDVAPGYGAWIGPVSKNISHIGLCRYHPCDVNIKEELFSFFKKRIKTGSKILGIHSGLIPISGPIKRTYGDRFLIIGDAAGQTGAMTAQGINYALEIGKLVGNVLAKNIDSPSRYALKEYEMKWKKEFANRLNYELLLRKLWDEINSNNEIEDLLKSFNDPRLILEIKRLVDESNLKTFSILDDLLLILLKNPSYAIKVLKDLIIERN